jgi:uncharacterized protein YqeY
MRRDRVLRFSAITALSVVLAYSVADAQPQPMMPQPTPQPMMQQPMQPMQQQPMQQQPMMQQPMPMPPDASAGLSRQVTLSPAEQLAATEQYILRMDAARLQIRRMLETARSQRDVVKTLCLNDKLNQMDVALRSARERRQALERAVTRRDADLANHEFTILNVLRQRTDQLTAEANLCIGKEIEDVGANAVTSTVDPGMPREDPSEYPNSTVIVEPPVCSSCFL